MTAKTLICIAALCTLAACSPSKDAAPAAAAPTPAPVQTAAAPEADSAQAVGEHIYKSTCSMCHASGAAGAPILGSAADWGPRVAQGKETLYTHALQGFTGAKGVMPAKGANASLKDDDVKAAVDYMVSKAK